MPSTPQAIAPSLFRVPTLTTVVDDSRWSPVHKTVRDLTFLREQLVRQLGRSGAFGTHRDIQALEMAICMLRETCEYILESWEMAKPHRKFKPRLVKMGIVKGE